LIKEQLLFLLIVVNQLVIDSIEDLIDDTKSDSFNNHATS